MWLLDRSENSIAEKGGMYRPSSFFTSLSFLRFILSHFLYSFVNARTFHSTRCFFHAYTWERISWFSKCNSRNRRRLHSVSCSLGRLCLPQGEVVGLCELFSCRFLTLTRNRRRSFRAIEKPRNSLYPCIVVRVFHFGGGSSQSQRLPHEAVGKN